MILSDDFQYSILYNYSITLAICAGYQLKDPFQIFSSIKRQFTQILRKLQFSIKYVLVLVLVFDVVRLSKETKDCNCCGYSHREMQTYNNTHKLDKIWIKYYVRSLSPKNIKIYNLMTDIQKINGSSIEHLSQVKQSFESKKHLNANEVFEVNKYENQQSINGGNRNDLEDIIAIRMLRQPQEGFIQQGCGACMDKLSIKDCYAFSDCGHHFCKSCIETKIQSSLGSNKLVHCLFLNCESILGISSPHLRSLGGSSQQKYYRILVAQNKQIMVTRSCPLQQCQGFVVVQQTRLVCRNCSNQCCKLCFRKKHEGVCDENQVNTVQSLYQQKKCKKCNRAVEQIEGCNRIQCICNYQFCYFCGKKWQINHFGCGFNQTNNQPSQRNWYDIFNEIKQAYGFGGFLLFIVVGLPIMFILQTIVAAVMLFFCFIWIPFCLTFTLYPLYAVYKMWEYKYWQIILGNLFLYLYCYGLTICLFSPVDARNEIFPKINRNLYWYFRMILGYQTKRQEVQEEDSMKKCHFYWYIILLIAGIVVMFVMLAKYGYLKIQASDNYSGGAF